MNDDILNDILNIVKSKKLISCLNLCGFKNMFDFLNFNEKCIENIEKYVRLKCKSMSRSERSIYLDDFDIDSPNDFLISPGIRNRLLKAVKSIEIRAQIIQPAVSSIIIQNFCQSPKISSISSRFHSDDNNIKNINSVKSSKSLFHCDNNQIYNQSINLINNNTNLINKIDNLASEKCSSDDGGASLSDIPIITIDLAKQNYKKISENISGNEIINDKNNENRVLTQNNLNNQSIIVNTIKGSFENIEKIKKNDQNNKEMLENVSGDNFINDKNDENRVITLNNFNNQSNVLINVKGVFENINEIKKNDQNNQNNKEMFENVSANKSLTFKNGENRVIVHNCLNNQATVSAKIKGAFENIKEIKNNNQNNKEMVEKFSVDKNNENRDFVHNYLNNQSSIVKGAFKNIEEIKNNDDVNNCKTTFNINNIFDDKLNLDDDETNQSILSSDKQYKRANNMNTSFGVIKTVNDIVSTDKQNISSSVIKAIDETLSLVKSVNNIEPILNTDINLSHKINNDDINQNNLQKYGVVEKCIKICSDKENSYPNDKKPSKSIFDDIKSTLARAQYQKTCAESSSIKSSSIIINNIAIDMNSYYDDMCKYLKTAFVNFPPLVPKVDFELEFQIDNDNLIESYGYFICNLCDKKKIKFRFNEQMCILFSNVKRHVSKDYEENISGVEESISRVEEGSTMETVKRVFSPETSCTYQTRNKILRKD